MKQKERSYISTCPVKWANKIILRRRGGERSFFLYTRQEILVSEMWTRQWLTYSRADCRLVNVHSGNWRISFFFCTPLYLERGVNETFQIFGIIYDPIGARLWANAMKEVHFADPLLDLGVKSENNHLDALVYYVASISVRLNHHHPFRNTEKTEGTLSPHVNFRVENTLDC